MNLKKILAGFSLLLKKNPAQIALRGVDEIGRNDESL